MANRRPEWKGFRGRLTPPDDPCVWHRHERGKLGRWSKGIWAGRGVKWGVCLISVAMELHGSGDREVGEGGGWNAGQGLHVGWKCEVGHHVGPGVGLVAVHQADHCVAQDVGFGGYVPLVADPSDPIPGFERPVEEGLVELDQELWVTPQRQNRDRTSQVKL